MSAREPDPDSYDRYVRAEWADFTASPGRAEAALAAVRGLSIRRVLDIGCGAGQELRPFIRGSAVGVGVDLSADVGKAGRELFAAEEPGSRVRFIRAAAENLPFRAQAFELVLCRLALPYMHNGRAFAEIARVLAPHGALLLTFHHARFYSIELRDALAARHFKQAIHACRVLLAGALYHLSGAQPPRVLSGGETFQTMWLLQRELRRHGLAVRRVLADSVPAAPSVVIARAEESIGTAPRS